VRQSPNSGVAEFKSSQPLYSFSNLFGWGYSCKCLTTIQPPTVLKIFPFRLSLLSDKELNCWDGCRYHRGRYIPDIEPTGMPASGHHHLFVSAFCLLPSAKNFYCHLEMLRQNRKRPWKTWSRPYFFRS
jgi:hypothetical protein